MSTPKRLILPGEAVVKDRVLVFQGPVCGAKMRYDDEYGPACTGPNPSKDEHPMTPMRRVG